MISLELMKEPFHTSMEQQTIYIVKRNSPCHEQCQSQVGKPVQYLGGFQGLPGQHRSEGLDRIGP